MTRRGRTYSPAIVAALYGAILIQILLLIIVGWQNRYNINPDAVSYIRIAMYYARGQFDLMVSGYWGPMLSWMIVPFLGLFDDPLYAARVATGLSAIVYLLGCIAVFRVLGIDSTAVVLATWISVVFSVYWSVKLITPDLLVSGLLCLGISRTLAPGWCESRATQFTSGALYGAAYLAKAVALPLSFVLIISVGVLWTIGKQTSLKRALRSMVFTCLGLLVVAGPWILVLSLKYEKPVFSTSGSYNHALVGPAVDHRHGNGHPTFSEFHVPEAGRMTSWEDPTSKAYPTWSPFESRQNVVHQLKVMRRNASRILDYLKSFDLLGIGSVAALFGFLFHTPWRENLRSERWRWAAILIMCLAGIYLPFSSGLRYFLATYPFLIGGSFGFVINMAQGLASNAKTLQRIAISLVTLSFVMAIEESFRQAFKPQTNASYAAARIFTTKLRAEDIVGPITSTVPSNMIAFYSAFLMDVPFHGSQPGAQTVEEVESSLGTVIVVSRTSSLDSQLDHDEAFISLDNVVFDSASEALRSPVKLYLNTNQLHG